MMSQEQKDTISEIKEQKDTISELKEAKDTISEFFPKRHGVHRSDLAKSRDPGSRVGLTVS